MAPLTFDTLKFAKRLTQAGFAVEQAEATAEALAEVFEASMGELATRRDLAQLATKQEIAQLATKQDVAQLATKQDVAQLASKLAAAQLETKQEMGGIRAELLVVKWMLGVVVTGIVALMLKAFF